MRISLIIAIVLLVLFVFLWATSIHSRDIERVEYRQEIERLKNSRDGWDLMYEDCMQRR